MVTTTELTQKHDQIRAILNFSILSDWVPDYRVKDFKRFLTKFNLEELRDRPVKSFVDQFRIAP